MKKLMYYAVTTMIMVILLTSVSYCTETIAWIDSDDHLFIETSYLVEEETSVTKSEALIVTIALVIIGILFIGQLLYISYHWTGRSWWRQERCKIESCHDFRFYWCTPKGWIPDSDYYAWRHMWFPLLPLCILALIIMLIAFFLVLTTPYGFYVLGVSVLL